MSKIVTLNNSIDKGEIFKTQYWLTIPTRGADLSAFIRLSVRDRGSCDVECVDEIFPHREVEVEDRLMLLDTLLSGFRSLTRLRRVWL